MLSRSTCFVVASVAVEALLGVLPGCHDSLTSPGINPEIVNQADHFAHQVSNIKSYSATASYTWSNSGAQATINQACSVSAGTATLIVLDGAAVQVYTRSLAENGIFTTASGTPGTWTIRIVHDGLSGTVNFRADVTT